MPRLDNATGWRRRALRLVELCMKLDAEHVLCKAMRRWPVAALLEATEGWSAEMFALVARDWRLRKVARLLEAKGRAFIVECCEEWEPEYLQLLLPELDLVTARHVLGRLFFKSDDRHLSAWECRCIIEQFGPRLQRKLLRKFEDRDVARVMHATESEDDDDDRLDGDDEEEDDSMDGFLVQDGEESEEDGEVAEGEEDDEDQEGVDIEMEDGEAAEDDDEDDDGEAEYDDGEEEEDDEEEAGECEEEEDEEEEDEAVKPVSVMTKKEQRDEALKKEIAAKIERIRAATAAVAKKQQQQQQCAPTSALKSARKSKRGAAARAASGDE